MDRTALRYLDTYGTSAPLRQADGDGVRVERYRRKQQPKCWKQQLLGDVTEDDKDMETSAERAVGQRCKLL